MTPLHCCNHYWIMCSHVLCWLLIFIITIWAAGLCVWSCRFVYAHIHVYVNKNKVFSAVSLKNILLSVFYFFLTEFKCLKYGLLNPTSCTCTNRAIHASPNKTQSLHLAPEYFFLSFNGTHSLGYYSFIIAASASVSVLVYYTCMPLWDYSS